MSDTACGQLAQILAFEGRRALPPVEATDAASERLWLRVIAAGLMCDLLPAVVDRVVPELFGEGGDEQPLTRIVGEIRGHVEAHQYRRMRQRVQLLELISGLNAAGIVPTLVGASRSLWLDRPRWRFQRGVPIFVERSELVGAKRVVEQLGYVAGGRGNDAGRGRHSNLLRPDTHGWIEVWEAGGHRRLERYLPHHRLRANCSDVSGDQASAIVLSDGADILHCMLCEHLDGKSQRCGSVQLKSLYEFAAAVRELDADGRVSLDALLAGSDELRSIFNVWVEAGVRYLALPGHGLLQLSVDVAPMPPEGPVSGHRLASLDEYRVPMPLAMGPGRAWLYRLRTGLGDRR